MISRRERFMSKKPLGMAVFFYVWKKLTAAYTLQYTEKYEKTTPLMRFTASAFSAHKLSFFLKYWSR
jgi:hypothetical protein